MNGFLKLDSRFVEKVLMQRYRSFYVGQKCNISLAPLLSPQWFDSILRRIIVELRERFFGYTYHVGTERKTLNRNTSNESLVDALSDYENYHEKNNHRFVEHINTYEFLKLVLEKNASLFGFEEDLFGPMGIQRDRSNLHSPMKKKVATQAVAQVIWSLKKSKVPTIKEMRKFILDKENPFYYFLGLERFTTCLDSDEGPAENTVEEWISEVFPISKNLRKGRPSKISKADHHFDKLIHIPGVFQKQEKIVNFPKLRFAIICLVRVLKIKDLTLEQIRESDLIKFYQGTFPTYLGMCLLDWVNEAFEKNGGIFDS